MPWSKPLAHTIPLKNGCTLRTLHDVRDLFTSGVFVAVKHSPALEHALDLLLKPGITFHISIWQRRERRARVATFRSRPPSKQVRFPMDKRVWWIVGVVVVLVIIAWTAGLFGPETSTTPPPATTSPPGMK